MVRQLPLGMAARVASDHAIRRVVLLDGHAASRFITALAVRTLGHLCIEAEAVPAAIAAIDRLRADTVVYEWRLPHGSAAGLSSELRRYMLREDVGSTIIVLSTQDEPAAFRDREDVDAYLTKPFDPRELRLLLGCAV